MIQQGGKPVCMAFGMEVFTAVTSGREAKSNMVGSNAPVFGPQTPDQMPKLEGPGGIAVYEHDRLALALVDKVHMMP